MPMYNLLQYTKNYSITLGSSWNYQIDNVNGNDSGNKFKYKTDPDPDGNQPPRPTRPSVPNLNVEITIPPNILVTFLDFLIYH